MNKEELKEIINSLIDERLKRFGLNEESIEGWKKKFEPKFHREGPTKSQTKIIKDTIPPPPPPPPLSRIIKEGTHGTCPKCHSTEVKQYSFFGRSLGCIQPECENYYKRFY